MRSYFLLLFLTTVLFKVQAQTPTDTLVYEMDDSLSTITPAVFPGGDEAFARYIFNRLMYPEDAKAQGIQGTTHIQFIIETDGSLSNIKVVHGKGLSPSCDQEAIRVISDSPKWTPAMKNGKPVRSKRTVRVKFALAGKKK